MEKSLRRSVLGILPLPYERTGNHSPYAMLTYKDGSGNIAHLIESGNRDYIFMGCNLKDTVKEVYTMG